MSTLDLAKARLLIQFQVSERLKCDFAKKDREEEQNGHGLGKEREF